MTCVVFLVWWCLFGASQCAENSMSQMSHCVLEVFIKNAGGLTRFKNDAPALEVRGLGNQTSRHRESAELRDAFPGLDKMQHDLRESERPTKGKVSLPDNGRLFVGYSPVKGMNPAPHIHEHLRYTIMATALRTPLRITTSRLSTLR